MLHNAAIRGFYWRAIVYYNEFMVMYDYTQKHK